MSILTDKILASAKRRLQIPEGRKPSQELSRYKDYLKHEAGRLLQAHQKGGEGGEICRARALVLDLLLKHVLGEVVKDLPKAEGGEPPRFALVATGGYGRGELNPLSDIDIMFLHNFDSGVLARGRVPAWLSAVTDGLLYTLWDVGLKVGHAVRSVEDCVTVANSDMQSKTSLLEARLIAGDELLFERMQAVFLAKSVRGQVDAYLAERIADQVARRAKHGNSATMQEPNIKNGCGGLRDYQNLLWMSFFKYRTRTLEELEEHDLISGEERRQLGEAYDFLLRVRNELHHVSKRAADVLPRALQPRVANHLGYTHRSPMRRLETFMRDLYINMRHIYLITRTVERRLALLPDPQRRVPSLRQLLRRGRRRMRRQVADGFEFAAGEVTTLSRDVFQDEPRRLVRVFFYAQQRGMTLHPDLTQLVRQQLSLVDSAFRKDIHVRETFLEILDQRGNVAPTLRAMHETGLLGRYMPEFAPLTCLVQHEFYHQYATDEHTLQCVEHLDRVWEAEEAPYGRYAEMFQDVERPSVLYLALLLHDVGKARHDEDHSVTGARMARTVARRLELDTATSDSLRVLIRQHLLMSQVSQRRDLDDPVVIRNFAAQVETEENLKMLTLHTLADSLGTSDELWNGFKDSLLFQLFQRAREHMSGTSTFWVAEGRRRERLERQVKRSLGGEMEDEEVRGHFEFMPTRYFAAHEPREIQTDLRLVRRFMERQSNARKKALAPELIWQDEPDRGCTELVVCTWDRSRAFCRITGALTAAGLNILGARIYTRLDNVIIDKFSVIDARTGFLVGKEARERCERLLVRGLTMPKVDFMEQIARRPAVPPLYCSVEGERMQASVRFDNETSDYYTVIDLEAEDHVGLLYVVSRELARLTLNVSLARISTEKGAAMDSFYVTEESGEKITAEPRLREIAERLQKRIGELE